MPYFPAPKDDRIPPDIAAMVTGWARVQPRLAWKRPGLPTEWCPVLECDPNEPTRAPLAGWLFLYVDGRIREVDGAPLEVVKGPNRAA